MMQEAAVEHLKLQMTKQKNGRFDSFTYSCMPNTPLYYQLILLPDLVLGGHDYTYIWMCVWLCVCAHMCVLMKFQQRKLDES